MAAARMAQQREKEARLAASAQFEKDEFLALAAVAAQYVFSSFYHTNSINLDEFLQICKIFVEK